MQRVIGQASQSHASRWVGQFLFFFTHLAWQLRFKASSSPDIQRVSTRVRESSERYLHSTCVHAALAVQLLHVGCTMQHVGHHRCVTLDPQFVL